MAFWLRTTTGLTPPVDTGNLILVNSWPAFLVAKAAAVSNDVISINHGAYVPSGNVEALELTQAYGGVGITLIGTEAQKVRIKVDSIANAQVEFVNWWANADAYMNHTTTTPNDGTPDFYTIYVRQSSKVAFYGCTAYQGIFGVYIWGSSTSDITIANCNISGQRHDGLRFDALCTRIEAYGNNIEDNAPQEQAWWKQDNTAPQIRSDFQSGYYFLNPDHADGTQTYNDVGTFTDIWVHHNRFKITVGQGIFYSQVAYTRVAITDNIIIPSYPWAVHVTDAQDVEVSRNTISKHPDYDPDSGVLLIMINRLSGTGRIKGGLNTYPGDTSVSASTLDLTGAINEVGGTVAAPNPPTWNTAGATVASLATLRLRKTYTPYSGTPKMTTGPSPRWDQSSGTAAAGSYLKAIPGCIEGHVFGFETTLYTRWMKNGVQQAVGQGTTAMVSPVTTAGTWRADQSFDGVTWYQGTNFTIT